MAKNNASIYDPSMLLQAGINPNTGLPVKMDIGGPQLKENIKRVLKIVDEQNAINRYTWYNLPSGLTGIDIERMLYYRGQLAFFYSQSNDTFYCLPYALSAPEGSTGLDIYGRFTGITPLTFQGTYENDEKKDRVFIQGMVKKPVYSMEDILIGAVNPLECCVLLSDYSKGVSQTITSRDILHDGIIDAEAEAFPLARTALIANSGIKGMRVNDEDQYANVKAASRSITKAALEGDPWVPFVGNVEFQDFTSNGSALKSEEFLTYMQSLDNFRLSLLGLQTGGIFQKKDHMLQDEFDKNSGTSSLVYQDGLALRQHFADMCNLIWGTTIYVAESEMVAGMDKDMDGDLNDETPAQQELQYGDDYGNDE